MEMQTNHTAEVEKRVTAIPIGQGTAADFSRYGRMPLSQDKSASLHLWKI